MSASGGRPYLSLVVTARNDDHGGDFLKRMQIFLDAFFEQARRTGLNSELIVVEWNPPADRPRLAQALDWSKRPAGCRVRILEVPPEAHRRYRYADRLALYQMIAKNAGIRRADGEFILATNIDLIFSNELADFLAARRLDPRRVYRIDRHDVGSGVPAEGPLQARLDWCRRNVLRVNRQSGTRDLRTAPAKKWARFLARPFREGGILNARRMGRKLRELWRSRSVPTVIRWLAGLVHRAVWHLSDMVRRSISRFKRRRITRLHTNACGDFTLLHRDRWRELRGYPELDMFSIHIDSVFLQMAHHGGARQAILREPMRLYHIEHASGWTPDESTRLRRRMESLGVPLVSDEQYVRWARHMTDTGSPLIFNDELWGLAQDELRETAP